MVRAKTNHVNHVNPVKQVRADIEYRLEKLDWGLKVLETLLTAPSRGYSTVDVQKATNLPYDFCKRALITLKLRGYARQLMGAWKPGDKCRVMAARTDLAFAEPTPDVLALADSMLTLDKVRLRNFGDGEDRFFNV